MREMCNTPQLRADATDAKNKKKTQEKAKTWQTLEAESSRLSSTCVDFRWISVDSQTNKSNPKLNSFASLDIRVLYMLWPKMYAERHTTQPPYVVTKFGYKFTAAAQTTRKTSLSNAACHFYLQIFVVLRFWLWFKHPFFFEWYLKLKLEFLTMSMAIKFQILALYRFNAK